MSHHILFTGGGTLGPVTPLLAVAAEWRKRDPSVKLSWVGTKTGPEKVLVTSAKIDFYPFSAPKFNRHRKWELVITPWLMLWSCLRAWLFLRAHKPDFVLSAGAYVSVPLVWMARLRGIPVWVHQLDVTPGLANRFMAWAATRISVTWPESLATFPAKKTELAGAMARKFVKVGEQDMARDRYGFAPDKPTIFVMGGGTGAAQINDLMSVIASDLVHTANVLHITGKGKMLSGLTDIGGNYVAVEFLNEGMADAYAVADVVVARAGMGTIAELAALGKPSILIPLPHSHQEQNVRALETRQAAEVMRDATPQALMQAIMKLLEHQPRREELSHNIRVVFPLNADERIVHGCLEILARRTAS